MHRQSRPAALGAALAAAVLLPALAAGQAAAAPVPQPQEITADTRAEAHRAATTPDTLATLARFFARDGALAPAAARPRIDAEVLPVRRLDPAFVAGRAGAPVSRVEFLAARAVAADGQRAVLWTARVADGTRRVVNIATGDEEFRYAALGASRAPGGTVFAEPQIDAWYVVTGDRVLPLDEDATKAVGAAGTTLAGYRARVVRAYGDKLPGSGYAEAGRAGGYGPNAERPDPGPAPVAAAPAPVAAPAPAGDHTALGLGAGLLAFAAGALAPLRRTRRARTRA
ncbi:hypothetical protein ACN20G_21030 [Streptomyces sp. BI20]|uniref:hypothetical protein n=1 Tax=Streptomyces sp. BI20 TaxID=3403460 RepID=UPI003C78A6E6